MRDRLHAPPEALSPQDVPPARWTLQAVKERIRELADYSLSGICQYLHRCGIVWRGGRVQYYSPDPDYRLKEAQVLDCLRQAGQAPGSIVALFLDEVSYTAWPDLAFAYSDPAPQPAPVADRQQSRYRRMRIIGALDALSGRVLVHQEGRIAGSVCAGFLQQVACAYPDAEHVYLIWDNWPVHHCHEVQAVLAQHRRLHAIALPTYAPWLNPIEKLWRKMRQEHTALHQLASDWKQLQTRTQAFFEQFAHGSTELVRYVGLLGEGKQAAALRSSSLTDFGC